MVKKPVFTKKNCYWRHSEAGDCWITSCDRAFFVPGPGYLRLSTPDPVCWHLGNKISV